MATIQNKWQNYDFVRNTYKTLRRIANVTIKAYSLFDFSLYGRYNIIAIKRKAIYVFP
jgi:hypothetical protein